MAFNINGTTPTSISFNGNPVYTLIFNGVTVWTAAVNVTYYVDSGTSYQESVVYGNSVLSPTSFTPSKSGYTFVGWRENSTASSSVLTSKTMGTTPISLYAVFKKTVTLTYYNNSTTAKSTSGTQYYNNGNVANPTFTLSQADKSGWTKRGWSTGTAGNASVTYSSISGTTFSSNTTVYGLYYQTVTQTFKSYNTSKTVNGTRYYNSAGNTANASVTAPTGATYSGWSWRGWSAANTTTANASVSYANSATISGLTGSNTFYGLYSQTITLSYNGNGSTSGSTTSHTGTRYWNAYGNTSNPNFTLKSNGFSRTDYSFNKWAQGSASGTQYSSGASVTLSANTTFYAVWKANAKTVTAANTSVTDDSWVSTGECVLVYGAIDASIYKSITVTVTEDWAECDFEGRTVYIGFASSTSSSAGNFTKTTPIGVAGRGWVSANPDAGSEYESYGYTTVTHEFAETSGKVYVYMGVVQCDSTTGYGKIKIGSSVTLNPR